MDSGGGKTGLTGPEAAAEEVTAAALQAYLVRTSEFSKWREFWKRMRARQPHWLRACPGRRARAHPSRDAAAGLGQGWW
jgi:hypothetical protein